MVNVDKIYQSHASYGLYIFFLVTRKSRVHVLWSFDSNGAISNAYLGARGFAMNGRSSKCLEKKFIFQPAILDTVDGRNPAPPGMVKTL